MNPANGQAKRDRYVAQNGILLYRRLAVGLIWRARGNAALLWNHGIVILLTRLEESNLTATSSLSGMKKRTRMGMK